MATTGYTPPLETYYPSCVVDLRIRFDDAFTLTKSGAVAMTVGEGTTPEQGLAIVQGQLNRLLQTSFRANAEAGDTGAPLFTSPTKTDDKLSHIIGRIPIRASVELPAYRQAGTFHLTFDYKDLPIDPRLIRSCGVTIYMDAVKAADFAVGATGKQAVGQAPSIIAPINRSTLLKQDKSNIALVGVVDNWSVDHGSKGSTVTIEGRDQRALLLNSPLNPALFDDLDLNQPIDNVIRDILAKHGGLGMIKVDPGPAVPELGGRTSYTEWPNGTIPSPATADGATSVSEQKFAQPPAPYKARNGVRTRSRKFASGKGWRPSAKGAMGAANYWDIIVNYCSLVGAVPYFSEENVLRIKPGRNLFDQNVPAQTAEQFKLKPSTGQPFARDVGESEPLRIRRMVFGHNVERMTFERKFLGIYGRTVKVYSLDTSSSQRGDQKLLSAEFPTDADYERMAKERGLLPPVATNVAKAKNTVEAPSGQTTTKEEIIIYVRGVNDQTRLQHIAEDLYQEMMRGEQGGSIQTRSLASFGGPGPNSAPDPDLLYVRPGDSVEIVVDSRPIGSRVPMVSTLNEQASGLSDGKLLKSLTEKLGDANLAMAIVASLKNYAFQLQNVYRVKDVKLDWDIASGFSISFNFQNYIIPRNGILPSQTAPTGATASAGSIVKPSFGTTGIPS